MSIKPGLAYFLERTMCIDVGDLEFKLSEPGVVDYSCELIEAIEGFVSALKREDAEREIQRIFMCYEHLFDCMDVYGVLDPLRHAFDGFAYGGLHQLFTRQENEAWYPKVILVDVLSPNDIDSLDECVVLYRGCGRSEFLSKEYGQSWSTSKKVANDFAFKHYQNYPWFDREDRVVMTSTVMRSGVLYSDQKGEFEVVVDTSKLGVVELCE